jgi:hypothetical protein
MATLDKLKKDLGKGGLIFSDELYNLSDMPEFLHHKKIIGSKGSHAKKQTVNRLSPFLISAVYLPFLFAYSIIKNDNDKWFLCFLLVFTEVNILFMDFALWDYYGRQKKLQIWVIETLVILGAIYFYFKAER